MSRRIGERLVAAGLLSQIQVDAALEDQLLAGGTIGTSLLDLGLIDEEVLGEALAGLLQVRHAGRKGLKNIPGDVIARLSSRHAEKHQAIPIAFENDTLHIATVHPRLAASLPKITGWEVVVWTAPEVRIYEALQDYYGIAMRPRHARIVKDLEARRRSRERGPSKNRVKTLAPSETAPAPQVEKAAIDLPEDYGYGRDWRTVAAELDPSGTPEAASQDPRAARPQPRPHADFDKIEDVYERFCDANFKEELFEATLGYISRKLETCILFGVRHKLAHVWDWRSTRLAAEQMGKLRIPVGAASIFGLLLGRSHYRGPLEDNDAYRRFYNMLKIDAPAEVLLAPVYVNDRLVVVVYGDNGTKPIGEDTEDYESLVEKLSVAFNLLILKMKIRA